MAATQPSGRERLSPDALQNALPGAVATYVDQVLKREDPCDWFQFFKTNFQGRKPEEISWGTVRSTMLGALKDHPDDTDAVNCIRTGVEIAYEMGIVEDVLVSVSFQHHKEIPSDLITRLLFHPDSNSTFRDMERIHTTLANYLGIEDAHSVKRLLLQKVVSAGKNFPLPVGSGGTSLSEQLDIQARATLQEKLQKIDDVSGHKDERRELLENQKNMYFTTGFSMDDGINETINYNLTLADVQNIVASSEPRTRIGMADFVQMCKERSELNITYEILSEYGVSDKAPLKLQRAIRDCIQKADPENPVAQFDQFVAENEALLLAFPTPLVNTIFYLEKNQLQQVKSDEVTSSKIDETTSSLTLELMRYSLLKKTYLEHQKRYSDSIPPFEIFNKFIDYSRDWDTGEFKDHSMYENLHWFVTAMRKAWGVEKFPTWENDPQKEDEFRHFFERLTSRTVSLIEELDRVTHTYLQSEYLLLKHAFGYDETERELFHLDSSHGMEVRSKAGIVRWDILSLCGTAVPILNTENLSNILFPPQNDIHYHDKKLFIDPSIDQNSIMQYVYGYEFTDYDRMCKLEESLRAKYKKTGKMCTEDDVKEAVLKVHAQLLEQGSNNSKSQKTPGWKRLFTRTKSE